MLTEAASPASAALTALRPRASANDDGWSVWTDRMGGGLCLASHWVQPFTHIGVVVREAEERNVEIRLLLKTIKYVLSGTYLNVIMLLTKLENKIIDSWQFDSCKTVSWMIKLTTFNDLKLTFMKLDILISWNNRKKETVLSEILPCEIRVPSWVYQRASGCQTSTNTRFQSFFDNSGWVFTHLLQIYFKRLFWQ